MTIVTTQEIEVSADAFKDIHGIPFIRGVNPPKLPDDQLLSEDEWVTRELKQNYRRKMWAYFNMLGLSPMQVTELSGKIDVMLKELTDKELY